MPRISSAAKKYMSGVSRRLGVKAPSYKKKMYRKARPARFPSGKRTYLQSRSVARELRNTAETKIQALTQRIGIAPSPVEVAPLVGPAFFTNYCLGTAPAAWIGPDGAAAFNDLDGFQWPAGTGPDQRIGQYMYLKRTTLNLRVAMSAQSRHGPTKFRVIVYKEKRNQYNVAGGGNPCENLFIDQTGQTRGVNSLSAPGARALDFNTWLVNKRNYQVVKDFKFTLANETLLVQGAIEPGNANQTNRAEKLLKFSLGHYQKAKFGQGDVPEDQMYRYCVTVISMPMSNSVAPHNDYSTYVNGVVSCLDN